MSFRGKMWTLLLSAMIAGYVLVGGLPFVGSLLQTQAQQPINDAGSQLRIFESVLQHIQNDYVDEPNLEKVRFGALRGLVAGLDPYSSYLNVDQVKDFNAKGTSNKVGVGAEFSQISQYLYVVSVIKGSNADKAGLKTGDVIEYVENRATRDISLYDAKQMIYGEPGTQISFRVLRSGEKPQIIKVTRGKYDYPNSESSIQQSNTGVIKVHSLEQGAAKDIREKVSAFTKQGVDKVVFDLRGVSRGTIEEAVDVANIFFKDGELAKILGRDNTVSKTFTADAAKSIYEGKLAVLIDFGTAGAGEIVAAAVAERKRGEVVGERSFGAGTEQQLFPLRGGDGLLLTVSKWASPAGVPFLADDRNSMGIKPTVEVKRPDTPEPLAVEELIEQQDEDQPNAQPSPTPVVKQEPVKPVTEDLQLKKAVELLQDKARSASSSQK